MCVDGPENAVREQDFEAAPLGPDNPHGNAVNIVERPLSRESEAAREIDLARSRSWKIVNTGQTNALGQHTAYRLVPGQNTLPYLQPRITDGAAGWVHVQALLGDPVRPRAALSRRLVSQPAPGRGWPAALDRGRSLAGG